MKSLGTILRNAIEQSGYSIYKVANKSGVNRTTLQKILSDDRPVSPEMMNSILGVLRLSPAEEAEVLTAFEISQSGEALYTLRQMTKQFLMNLFDADCFFSHHRPDPTTEVEIPAAFSYAGVQTLISNRYQTEALLAFLIDQECQKAEPCICISLPGTLPLLYESFFHKILSKTLPKQLKITHVIQLLRSANIENDSVANLNMLSKLLPFSILTSLDYKILYFYTSQPDPVMPAFPYYMLFSDTLLLLSSDGSLALPCHDSTTVQYFKFLFDQISKKAATLIDPLSSASEYLDHLLDMDAKDNGFHSIEHQPCFTTFLTKELVFRYAREDLPQREALIEMLLLRIEQLSGLLNRCCIFSKSGLLEFAATGIITDLPSPYFLPLTLPDRILVLKRMHSYIETGKQAFHMTNPAVFPLPPHLLCIIRKDIDVAFTYFNQDLMEFKHIHIQEPSLLDTFEDFFQYALQSFILYSREETMQEILQCIQNLEHDAGGIR